MTKDTILSVTKDDCEWIYQRGRGNGGQKKNKTNSAVICSHRPSAAQGYAEDHREQGRNRELAFKRMAETSKPEPKIDSEKINLKKIAIITLLIMLLGAISVYFEHRVDPVVNPVGNYVGGIVETKFGNYPLSHKRVCKVGIEEVSYE